MKKYLKRGALVLTVLVTVVAAVLAYNKLTVYMFEMKTPEVKKTMQKIVEENKADLETISMDMSKVSTEDIYKQIHRMANTLIVAADGKIIGEIPINKNNISIAMYMVKESDELKDKEKEVFMNILEDWGAGNFSNGVQAHNYAWNKLKGSVGRAKDIRVEYK